MAIPSDQMTMELKKSKLQTAAQVLPQAGFQFDLHGLMSALQTSIQLNELLPIFGRELSKTVNYQGMAYTNGDANAEIQLGQRANHSCEYSLTIEQESLGSISFMRRKRFEEFELELIEQFLSALLHPLKNALLYHQALLSAHTDALTGVLNRSTLHSTFQKEVAFAKRHKSPMSLVMLDIDHFKMINDTYGHAAGDLALKALTQSLKETARENDHIFRMGGEEFALVLNSTDLQGAELLAERLRKNIESMTVTIPEGELQFTVSLGITALNTKDTLDSLMDRADKALYNAKHNGRNQVFTG